MISERATGYYDIDNINLEKFENTHKKELQKAEVKLNDETDHLRKTVSTLRKKLENNFFYRSKSGGNKFPKTI